MTAPTQLTFGRVQSGTNYLVGSLDEIATYTAALPEATVLNHYQTGLP